MFITAVCFLFFIKLQTIYGQNDEYSSVVMWCQTQISKPTRDLRTRLVKPFCRF